MRYHPVGRNNKSFAHCARFVINCPLKRGRRCGQVETFCLPCEWSLSFASPSRNSSFCTSVRRNCLRIVRRQEVGNATSGRTSARRQLKILYFQNIHPHGLTNKRKRKNKWIPFLLNSTTTPFVSSIFLSWWTKHS